MESQHNDYNNEKLKYNIKQKNNRQRSAKAEGIKK